MEEMEMKEFHKELDMIQSCINRMAHNSFQIKGWAVTVNLAFVALAQKIDSLYVCIIVLVSIFVFWSLDAFFLQTEKKYRKMYEQVRKDRLTGQDNDKYKLDPTLYNTKVPDLCKVMMSDTLAWFYGSFATLTIIFLVVILINKVG